MLDSKAVKFNHGKEKTRYFYWEPLGTLFPRQNLDLGFTKLDILMKDLQHDEYEGALLTLKAMTEAIEHHMIMEGIDTPMLGVTQASETGALKYGHFNYQKGFQWGELVDAAGRHILKILAGQKYDQESGLDHRYHILANYLMLVYHIRVGVGVNDFLIEEKLDESSNSAISKL